MNRIGEPKAAAAKILNLGEFKVKGSEQSRMTIEGDSEPIKQKREKREEKREKQNMDKEAKEKANTA